ncbi:Competence protein F, phosphoribosyltransferase domain [Clostridiaceae bacterium JG1575]|nr:Competence protein F, phosphoribosyltransferase domain [Clostridiaceae bacterium JG1575]
MMAKATLRKGIVSLLFEQRECPICKASSDGVCALCLKTLRPYGSFAVGDLPGDALFYYCGTAQALLHEYKNHHCFAAKDALLQYLIQWTPPGGFTPDCIVPIPSCRANLKKRGFDPCGDLARSWGRALEVPVVQGLINLRDGQQKKKNRNQRLQNLQQAFALREDTIHQLKGRSILLFDDVATTGASLRGAQWVLEKLPEVSLRFLVVARASPLA